MAFIERVSYRIPELVAATGIPRTTVYDEIRRGRLRVLKLGARTIVTAHAMREWLAQLEAEQAGAGGQR